MTEKREIKPQPRTLTTSQSQFYTDINKRFDRIEYMRMGGSLPQKATRNPLRAEKTPRKEALSCADFEVPEKPSHMIAPERWHYPETDWGLMAKFR